MGGESGPITKEKKKKKKSQRAGERRVSSLSQLAPDIAALDSVQEVVDFESPKGRKYKILKTTETEAYDPPPGSPKKRRGTLFSVGG